METLWQDVRYALRTLAKDPGFAAIAVLTLALGIGANTAIFSVVNSVLLRPLPYKNADRLVWAWGSSARGNEAAVSPADFLDYRAQNHVFEQFAAAGLEDSLSNLHGADRPVQVHSALVTAGFFETFGVQPALGRTFSSADEQVKLPLTVILSDRLWRERFGADSAIVGKNVMMDASSMTVAGVMPASFNYPPTADVWIPAPFLHAEMATRRAHFLRPIGLLKPGVSLGAAQAEVDIIAQRLERQYPDTNTQWKLLLEPLQQVQVGSVRPALLIMLMAVALVLLIACANVANLLLARTTSRQREIAIRAALGAGRSRVLRQLLTESVLLALAGGIAGALLAAWGVAALRALGPDSIPRLAEVRLDGKVLAYTAVISLLTGLVFGLGPALHATKDDLQQALKEGSRSSGEGARHRLRNGLVVSEVALSLTLLMAAGLLLNSFWHLMHVNPGFDSSHVLTTRIVLPYTAYGEDARQVRFFKQLMETIEAAPGVESAGAVSELPLSGQPNDTLFTIVEHPPRNPRDNEDAHDRRVTDDYLKAMHIPLLAGRMFSPQDSASSARTVIVNEPFVRRYFPGENPLGKHLAIFEGDPKFVPTEIVGVVGGIRHSALNSPPPPEMYLPYAQTPFSSMNLVVRGAGDPAALAGVVRAAVTSIDKHEAISAISTMQEVVTKSTANDRFTAVLLACFGAMALLLAAAGIYGVISYSVTQRTREIGIRLAVGATPRDVLRLVIRHGMTLTLIGCGLGLVAAVALAGLLRGQLFGVTATDPATFAGVAALMAVVALAACYVPARRATRVDPIAALRHE